VRWSGFQVHSDSWGAKTHPRASLGASSSRRYAAGFDFCGSGSDSMMRAVTVNGWGLDLRTMKVIVLGSDLMVCTMKVIVLGGGVVGR
jgi:hypothetical protein